MLEEYFPGFYDTMPSQIVWGHRDCVIIIRLYQSLQVIIGIQLPTGRFNSTIFISFLLHFSLTRPSLSPYLFFSYIFYQSLCSDFPTLLISHHFLCILPSFIFHHISYAFLCGDFPTLLISHQFLCVLPPLITFPMHHTSLMWHVTHVTSDGSIFIYDHQFALSYTGYW